MRATLDRLVNSGVPALICPRCGWWKGITDPKVLIGAVIEAVECPDCKGPLDAVDPKR